MDRKQDDIINAMIELSSGSRQTSTRKLIYNPVTKMIESTANGMVNPDEVITITSDDATMF